MTPIIGPDPPGERPGGVLQALKRRKLLVAVPFCLTTALAWAVVSNVPRRYAAEATLAFDARRVQVVENEVVSRLPNEGAALRTELDIIASRSLAERVVGKLDLAADPAVLREVGAEGWLWAALAPALRVLDVALRGADPDGAPAEVAPAPRPGRGAVVNWLLTNVKASNDGRSFTIFVSFNAEDPRLAARIANAFATEYLEDQIDRKTAATQRASAWLAGRLDEIRREVDAADAAVSQFRRSSGLIEARGATVLGQQLSELNTQLATARAERARAEGKLQMARTSNGQSVPEVLASPTIQQLRVQLSKAETALAENANNLYMRPELERTINSLRRQIDVEVARVLASLSAEVEAARGREASLAASIQRLQADYGEASTGLVKLGQLQREAEASRKLYETFLGRYKQAAEQASLAAPEARLIAAAQTPAVPVFPKPVPILLLSGLAGALLGAAAAVAGERMDNRVHEAGWFDTATGLPVLGVVPKLSRFWGRPRIARTGRTGASLGAALQWLHAALRPFKPPERALVVFVTAATPSEDKTSLSVCFARKLAHEGARVLLIDADPHRPRVMQAFGEARRRFLASSAKKAGDACDLVRADAESGAHFLAATPKQIRHMLASGLLARLLEEARTNYDVVVLDGAPVLDGADAIEVGRLADVRFLVARCGTTRRDRVLSALSVLRLYGSAADGLVVTGVDRRSLYAVLSGRPAPRAEPRRRRPEDFVPGDLDLVARASDRRPSLQEALHRSPLVPRGEAAG